MLPQNFPAELVGTLLPGPFGPLLMKACERDRGAHPSGGAVCAPRAFIPPAWDEDKWDQGVQLWAGVPCVAKWVPQAK